MTGATSISGDYQWEDRGHQDWEASARGVSLSYAGARSGVGGRPLSTMTLAFSGLRPAALWLEGNSDFAVKRALRPPQLATGDAEFDNRVCLVTDDAVLASALGRKPEARRAIERAIECGVRQIEFTADGVKADVRPLDLQVAEKPALTALAATLLDLARMWPMDRELPLARMSPLAKFGLFWWSGVTLLPIIFSPSYHYEAGERQLDTVPGFDWLGLIGYCLIAFAPMFGLFTRRGRQYIIAIFMMFLNLITLPFHYWPLLQVAPNQLIAHNERIVPATLLDIRPDRDGLHRDGYEAIVQIYERETHWELTPAEGQLAREGRLCVAAVEAEGLRGLRYVKAVKTWRCRPGEENPALPPIDGETR